MKILSNVSTSKDIVNKITADLLIKSKIYNELTTSTIKRVVRCYFKIDTTLVYTAGQPRYWNYYTNIPDEEALVFTLVDSSNESYLDQYDYHYFKVNSSSAPSKIYFDISWKGISLGRCCINSSSSGDATSIYKTFLYVYYAKNDKLYFSLTSKLLAAFNTNVSWQYSTNISDPSKIKFVPVTESDSQYFSKYDISGFILISQPSDGRTNIPFYIYYGDEQLPGYAYVCFSSRTYINSTVEWTSIITDHSSTAMSGLNETTFVETMMPVGHIITTTDSSFDPNVEYTATTWEMIPNGLFLESSSTAGVEKLPGVPNITGTISCDNGVVPFSNANGVLASNTDTVSLTVQSTDTTYTLSMNQSIVAAYDRFVSWTITTNIPDDRLTLEAYDSSQSNYYTTLTKSGFTLSKANSTAWTGGSGNPLYVSLYFTKNDNTKEKIGDISVWMSSNYSVKTTLNWSYTESLTSSSVGESITFDSSNSNSIYGSSSTVQPHSLTVIMWKRTA